MKLIEYHDYADKEVFIYKVNGKRVVTERVKEETEKAKKPVKSKGNTSK